MSPARPGSRMQQQFDLQTQEDRESPGGVDGAAMNGLHPDDPAHATPRSDKAGNSLSAPTAVGPNGSPNKTDSDEEGFDEAPPPRNLVANGGGGGYWRQGGGALVASRPHSPSAVAMVDNASEASSMIPTVRPKSRAELATSRYSNLSYWRARRVVFYKNGDPFFPGVEFRFKPGRDIGSIESLLDKLSLRMDLPRGARYIFSMDGDRKYRLDELEDGASYVVSSYKTFKVRFVLMFSNSRLVALLNRHYYLTLPYESLCPEGDSS